MRGVLLPGTLSAPIVDSEEVADGTETNSSLQNAPLLNKTRIMSILCSWFPDGGENAINEENFKQVLDEVDRCIWMRLGGLGWGWVGWDEMGWSGMGWGGVRQEYTLQSPSPSPLPSLRPSSPYLAQVFTSITQPRCNSKLHPQEANS